MHFLCQIFTYFCEWEPPDSNRRLCRVITNTFILKDLTPLIAIDQKYILLSCYKLHRYISYFFQHNEMKSLFERFALTLYIHDVASLSIILWYFSTLASNWIHYDNYYTSWINTMSYINIVCEYPINFTVQGKEIVLFIHEQSHNFITEHHNATSFGEASCLCLNLSYNQR